eukprot:6206515-Pleurochrysis_carterae.AAC.4
MPRVSPSMRCNQSTIDCGSYHHIAVSSKRLRALPPALLPGTREFHTTAYTRPKTRQARNFEGLREERFLSRGQWCWYVAVVPGWPEVSSKGKRGRMKQIDKERDLLRHPSLPNTQSAR